MFRFIAKAVCALGCALLCAGLWLEISEDPALAPRHTPAQSAIVTPHASGEIPPTPLASHARQALLETVSAAPAPAPAPPAKPPERGSLIGEVVIPAIGVSVDLIEGSGDAELLLGAGRVSGSDPPGGEHCVIAGHRVTRKMHPFRYLHRLSEGDEIIVAAGGEEFRYAVLEAFIVYADETWVLSPFTDEAPSLTLITCHPPGSARKRWIVRALFVGDAAAGKNERI